MRIRVVLADDHKIVRDGLKSLLDQCPDIEVVAVADHGRQLLALVEADPPEVVLLDVSMPEMNGIDVVRRLSANCPTVKVVMLSMHSDRRFVTESLSAGARGYLLKDSAFEELVRAIMAVNNGEFYLSPKIAGVIVQDYLRKSSPPVETAFNILTNREREVLQLIAEGKSTKEIAFNFNVSIKTVETQRQQIMKKLNMFSVAELTKYAIREGLTAL
jgi:DNA-binding NarL/FixJ family response regulator